MSEIANDSNNSNENINNNINNPPNTASEMDIQQQPIG